MDLHKKMKVGSIATEGGRFLFYKKKGHRGYCVMARITTATSSIKADDMISYELCGKKFGHFISKIE